MKLRVELPDARVTGTVELYSRVAPAVCKAVFDSVAVPLETQTRHACFDGHEVFCFLPAFPDTPPLENRTMRPQPGEVMFFHARKNDFAFLQQDRMSPSPEEMHELAFMYGEVDLRHFWEEGLHGSLIGKFSEGLTDFAEACARTLAEGGTRLLISQDF